MLYYLQWTLALVANCLFLSGVMAADNPREVNFAYLLNSLRTVPWFLDQMNLGLRNFADKIEVTSNTDESSESYCLPEFDPVPLDSITSLPEDREIGEIISKLGKPCKEDEEKIYYPTEEGDIVYFWKRSGKGGFVN